jgi:hypothetical protein
MKITTYNPTTGNPIVDDATGVDFGKTIQGNHISTPIVIKPVVTTESNFTHLALFLEDRGTFTNSLFGKYKNATFIPGVVAGSNYLSDHFVQRTGVSDFYAEDSTMAIEGLVLTAASPEYVWLDAHVGYIQAVGSDNINYRFVFDYV